jgi:tRNA G18 (ribose-2'-O)-methylase SpoU
LSQTVVETVGKIGAANRPIRAHLACEMMQQRAANNASMSDPSSSHSQPNVVEIDSLDDARLGAYANLRDAQLRHAERGQFMAEGELVVRLLIESGRAVDSVLLTRLRLESMRQDLALLPQSTPVYLVPQQVMDGIVGMHMHRGVLAVGRRGVPRSADDVIAAAGGLLVLEDLSNHDNVGSLFRSAAGLMPRDGGVLLSPGCCDPLYRKSLRVSMGHALRVPYATLEPWPEGLAALKARGFTVVALTPGEGSVDIGEAAQRVQRPGVRVAIMLGTEGVGLSDAAQSAADLRVRIAMNAGVDSLNVAVAGAIAMQRLFRPGS